MYLKLALVLVIVLVDVAALEKTELGIVSSSQRPINDDRLTKLEERVESCARLAETNHRIEALELQNKQIQNALDNINFALTNLTDKFTEVTSIRNKLETNELHNKQMQIRLQSVDSVFSEVTSMRKKLNVLELQIPLRNCKELKERGRNVSHIYRIKPNLSPEPFPVLCNMDTRGGGWTYVLNRFDGSQDFYLNWNDYKNGFGTFAGEFWLGLEHLYQLTGDNIHELLIELVDQEQKKVYAHYSEFAIGDETEGYYLKVLKGYSGDAGDSFSFHSGMKFSTKDKDNDKWSIGRCAILLKGAWWYKDCMRSQLTGRYLEKNSYPRGEGIHWKSFNDIQSLKQARMMIRPVDITTPSLVSHEIKN